MSTVLPRETSLQLAKISKMTHLYKTGAIGVQTKNRNNRIFWEGLDSQ